MCVSVFVCECSPQIHGELLQGLLASSPFIPTTVHRQPHPWKCSPPCLRWNIYQPNRNVFLGNAPSFFFFSLKFFPLLFCNTSRFVTTNHYLSPSFACTQKKPTPTHRMVHSSLVNDNRKILQGVAYILLCRRSYIRLKTKTMQAEVSHRKTGVCVFSTAATQSVIPLIKWNHTVH